MILWIIILVIYFSRKEKWDIKFKKIRKKGKGKALKILFFPQRVGGFIVRAILGRTPFSMVVFFILSSLIVSFWWLVKVSLQSKGLDTATNIIRMISWHNTLGMFFVLFVDYQDYDVEITGALGKAKFLDGKTLHENGFIDKEKGLVLGKINGNIVQRPTHKDGNIGICGGSRTGKTASNLIPTILNWQGKGLVIDIKPELVKKTSHLKKNNFVLSLNEQKAKYNPLAHLKTVRDVLDMSTILFPIDENVKEPYFKQSAQNIFSASAWEFKNKKSFGKLCKWLCSTDIQTIVTTLSDSTNDNTKMLISAVSNIKLEQLGSIMNEIRNTLLVYAVDENLQYVTSGSDFSPESIENNWVYLEITEDTLSVYGGFISLIITQFVRYCSKRQEYQEPPILLALDEFPRLAKMDVLIEGLGTLGSRNVTTMLIFQSLAQIDKKYGKDTTKIIMDNLLYFVVHNATDTSSQEYFSRKAGNKTEIVKNQSRKEGIGTDQNFSYNQQSVPLIRPEEFANLKKPIAFLYQVGIAELDKSFWFENTEMKKLILGD